jgi:carboxyl-terminal processing protease
MARMRTYVSYLIGVVIVAASFGLGMFFGASRSGMLAAAAAYQSAGFDGMPGNADFAPLWRVWKAIDERYVPGRIATTTATSTPTGATDPQERIWGMAQGLAASIGDPYTVFFPPADAEIFEDDISGSFEGVGMEIAIRSNVLTVVSPLKDSPAQKAGMLAGDKILKIDDMPTEGLPVDKAVKRIRGPKGTVVTVTIYREGEKEPRDIKITRDVINIPTLQTETKNGVFIIELYNFSAVSPELFKNALEEFTKSGLSHLIVDLRGNPGGYLEAAVDMASWFLPSGAMVVTEDYGARGNPVEHRSRGYKVFADDFRIVVLIDKGSASASEILAGALRDHDKATLIGSHSFGKGSVQELVPITPETSLKITVARWLLPDGAQIPDSGIKPDIEVARTAEDVEKGKDPQLDRAITFIKTGK